MLALVACIGGYITYLKWQRSRAEARASAAAQERDNAIVELATTQTAQDAEHAYQQAHDDVMHHDSDKSSSASMLDKLNSTSPLLLMFVLLLGGCATSARVITSNPANQVIIPASGPLAHYEFQIKQGDYCLDHNNAAIFLNDFNKRTARIKGLEAALRELGATVK